MANDQQRNVLLVPLIILTVSIIILSLLSQYFINASLKGIKAYVNTIAVVNKERMLSQEMVKAIATDNLLGQLGAIGSLDSLMSTFKHLNQIILTGDTEMNLQPLSSEFAAYYQRQDKALNNFYHVIQLNIGDDNDNNTLFFQLLSAQNIYLKQLDKLADAINNNTNNKVSRFQLVQLTATYSSVLIVAMEFAFILLPAFNKIKKQNKHLTQIAYNQSHLVRHPLTNIKELLYLMNIYKTSKEMDELLLMANKEADKLDAIISDTVYNAAQNEGI